MSNPSKIFALDGLRGVAAIFVIFSHITLLICPYLHLGASFDANPKSWATHLFNSPFTFFFKGTSAVMLFFVMSGFVLSYSMIRRGARKGFLLRAVIKRYFRLNIPVASSIILCVILMGLGAFTANLVGPRYDLYNAYTASFEALTPVKDAIYGSIFLGNGTFNYVLWTINIEFFGSIMVYALLALMSSRLTMLRIVCLVISVCGIHSGVPFVWGIGLFAVGVFLATFDVVHEGATIRKAGSYILLIVGVYLYGFNSESASYALVNHVLDYANDKGLQLTKGFIVSIIGTIMIMTCFVISMQPLKFLELRFFQWLGRLSFSVYLIHTIILAIIAPLVITRFSFSLTSIMICAIAVVPITLAVSCLFSKYIDEVAISKSGPIATSILAIFKKNSELT